MIGFLALTVANAVTPAPTASNLPCDGIREIEVASIERPLPFESLREMGTMRRWGSYAGGPLIEQQISVANVKALNGFARCRFVYTNQIDLACYVPGTVLDADEEAVAKRMVAVAESIGACLRNPALLRQPSEAGSTPSIGFSAGPRHPFWQISMVPTEEDPSLLQAEVLILGPAEVATPPRPVRPSRAAPKAKRKRR